MGWDGIMGAWWEMDKNRLCQAGTRPERGSSLGAEKLVPSTFMFHFWLIAHQRFLYHHHSLIQSFGQSVWCAPSRSNEANTDIHRHTTRAHGRCAMRLSMMSSDFRHSYVTSMSFRNIFHLVSVTSYTSLSLCPFSMRTLPLIAWSNSVNMFLCHSFLLVALSLFSSTLAVSVTLYSPSAMHDEWLNCPSLLPGQCCLEPSNPLPYPYGEYHRISNEVNFTGLMPNHIAAIWGSKPRSRSLPGWPAGGCSGRVVDSRNGPGDWNWRSSRRDVRTGDDDGNPIEIYRSWATGASYIEMPTALPPDGKTITWLEGT